MEAPTQAKLSCRQAPPNRPLYAKVCHLGANTPVAPQVLGCFEGDLSFIDEDPSKGSQKPLQASSRLRIFRLNQKSMDNAASDLPSLEELQESIDELSAYRERLFQDVVGLGKKLRVSQKKIDATVAAHPELQRLDEVMSQLVAQRNAQQSQS